MVITVAKNIQYHFGAPQNSGALGFSPFSHMADPALQLKYNQSSDQKMSLRKSGCEDNMGYM